MKAWSGALLCAAWLVAQPAPATAQDPGEALSAVLAGQRALWIEAQQRGEVRAPFPTAHLDAFEAELLAQDLLESPEGSVQATPAVSSPPRADPPSRSQRGRARLAELASSDASEEEVERELESLAREQREADARALVQDVLFLAVAHTAVELRYQLDELRRNQALRAAVRDQLRSLRAALVSASAEAGERGLRELRRLERDLGEADGRVERSSFDLVALLRDHEALFDRLARLSRRLYARARVALREAGS